MSIASTAAAATDAILSIRIVDGLDQAIEHINHYGSHHTDSIVTDTWGSPLARLSAPMARPIQYAVSAVRV